MTNSKSGYSRVTRDTSNAEYNILDRDDIKAINISLHTDSEQMTKPHIDFKTTTSAYTCENPLDNS